MVIAVVLAACPASSPSPRSSPQPQRGGTLRVLLAEDVDALDPHVAGRPSSWFFARALHRGLLAFPDAQSPDGAEPVPDLAEALPEIDAAGTALTFRLREGATFPPPADRPVRAADVAASIERARTAGVGIAPFLDVVASVDAPDERTVVVRLRRPAADATWILAHPQMAILPAGTDLRVDPVAIPGAGPYRLARYEPERSILLERNTAWDAGSDPVRPAYVDTIEAELNARDRAARVADGEADLVLDPGPPDADDEAVPAGARTAQVVNGCTRYLLLDAARAPFDLPAARAAVARAVVRDALPEDGGAPAQRMLPPTSYGHRAEPVIPEDLAGATRLAATVAPLTATLLAGNTGRDRAEAEAIVTALARAKIEVKTRFVPPAALYPSWIEERSRGLQMALATWCADWPGANARNVLSRTALRAGEVPVARLVAAANVPGPDPAVQAAEADRAIVASAVVVPLRWGTETVVRSPRLRGESGAPMWPRGDPAGLWLAP